MKKNNMPLTAIYETINVESFEQLGYKVISKDKMQINFGKTVEIDKDNSIYVSLSFQHPVFTILSKDFQIGGMMESLSESLFDDKPKLTKEEKLKKKIKRALPGMAQSIIHKENHNNEMSLQDQLTMFMGAYEGGRAMTITDDEQKLVKEWNPLAGKFVEYLKVNNIMNVYSNCEFSDEEWEKEKDPYEKAWARYKVLEKELIEDVYKLFILLEEKGVKLEVEGDVINGFRFKDSKEKQ